MFGIFKKAQKQPDNIVELIHNDFDTATERILKEAKEIIDRGPRLKGLPGDPLIESMGTRLQQLGFKNAKASKLKEQIQRDREFVIRSNVEAEKTYAMTIQKAELIQAYQNMQPFLKFLTKEILDQICQKYGLIYAPVSAYLGDVPEKNLLEIERVPMLPRGFEAKRELSVIVKKVMSDTPRELKDLLLHKRYSLPDYVVDDIYSYSTGGRVGNTHIEKLATSLGYKGGFPNYILGEVEVELDDKKGLYIAAPQSEFLLDGLNMKSKFGYAQKVSYIVEDPIVFRYCKGGIQVLSKWGKEAEAVVNPIEN